MQINNYSMIQNNESEITNQSEISNESDEKNKINNLIKELEEDSEDSINSNYFTEEEKNKIKNTKYKYSMIYYICLLVGFYLMYSCSEESYLMLFFEIILNICYPYIFIPIKLFLCRDKLTKICIPLYN
tara:strand:+ start:1372 stop:1758 length:387 start_codon:yes stop_codon:yes gene_type:complete